jgi:hypothetical protein
MTLLPEFTHLGKLTIIEVYAAYDEPCLFACQNGSGQIYISVLIDEDEDYKKWLYTAISTTRFNYMRSGGIDLHDSFKMSEDSFSFVIEVPFLKGEESIVTVLPRGDISQNMLPLPGRFIELETSTLAVLPTQDLKSTALSSRREILRFKVHFPKYFRNEAPTKPFCKILSSLQETIEAIGSKNYISGSSDYKRALKESELLLTSTSGGSYCIDMIASVTVDFFNDSLLGESIDGFLKLIKASDIKMGDDFFIESAKKLNKRCIAKYYSFLSSIANVESDISLNWGSPHPEKGGLAELSYKNVTWALDLIKKVKIDEPETIEVIGVLVGGHTDKKTFVFRSLNGFEYKGLIVDSLMTSGIYMTLENKKEPIVYKAIIEETIEVNKVTAESKQTYKLITLKIIDI